MKRIFLITLILGGVLGLSAQGPLITEISYDNNYDQDDPFGIDSIEYVEVYINNPQPTDLTSFIVATYNPDSGDNTVANLHKWRNLEDTLRTWATPNGKYYVVEFPDSTFFDFPIGGMNDGQNGVALIEVGTPNIVHQFWRYETCEDFTAADGPATGATSDPITTDFSRVCGSSGVSLVQMNSALSTFVTLQQNGFGDWELAANTSRIAPLENDSNVPVELINFDAFRKETNVKLEWSTASEVNNAYFEVLYSTNGVDYKAIGQVDGKGESSERTSYDFLHLNVESDINYYKLSQYDYDGKSEMFDAVLVRMANENSISIYPTVAFDYIQVEGANFSDDYIILGVDGRILQKANMNSTPIDVSFLNNGTYFLKIGDVVKRFIINK